MRECWELTGKIPNPKNQIPKKFQIPITESEKRIPRFGIWFLDFGI
jgi:hypothetical protein